MTILAQAHDSLAAEIFIVVPDRDDITHPEGVNIHWLPCGDMAGRPGAHTLDVLRTTTLPQGRFYTWVAGESALATGLRRHLTKDRHVAKSDITFTGYWRHGRTSPG